MIAQDMSQGDTLYQNLEFAFVASKKQPKATGELVINIEESKAAALPQSRIGAVEEQKEESKVAVQASSASEDLIKRLG